ncbi:MAG: nuclear transport factor 2 family protein [Dehalococcoidia bacterium]
MSVDANKQVVRSMLAALADADYERMFGFLHEDIRFYVIGTTKYSGLFVGKKDFWERLLKPMTDQIGEGGFREEIVKVIGEGDLIVTESRGFEKLANGMDYNNEYAFIYRLRDGLIVEWNCYLDTALIDSTHD